ncbi:MAG: hypothetical protein JNL57_00350 [Bacteroidetes bacterium]|nr:hypothetical protein [Bacteroidota bacterium]
MKHIIFFAAFLLATVGAIQAQKSEDCKIESISTVYISKSGSEKTAAIVIALNTSKEDKSVPLATALETEELSSVSYLVASNGKYTFTLEAKLEDNSKEGRLEYRFALPDDDGKTPWEWTSSNLILRTQCGTRTVYAIQNKKKNALSSNWNAYDATPQEKSNDNSNFKVEYLNIQPSSFEISGGNIVFQDNSTVTMRSSVITNGNPPAAVWFILTGTDRKGQALYHRARATYYKSSREYRADSKFDNAFILGETNCSLMNLYEDTTTFTGTYGKADKKTSFAVLLYGKNRPAKYGQCWVFSKSTGKNDSFVNIGDIETVTTNTVNKEKGNYNTTIELDFPGKKDNPSKMQELLIWDEVKVYFEAELSDKDGKLFTATLKQKFDEKRGNVILYYSGTSNNPVWIQSLYMKRADYCGTGTAQTVDTDLKTGTDAGDSRTEIWKALQETGDGCSNQMQIEDATASAKRVSGVYALNFELTPGKKFDANGYIVVNLKMVNCKGTTEYVDVKLSYNKSTGTFTGNVGFYDEKDCKWNCEDLSLRTYNACGELLKKGGFPALITKMKDKIAKGDV